MNAPSRSLPEAVLAMRRGWPRIQHVLKHLYRPSERWDLIVPALPANLAERARHAGCAAMERVQRGADHWEPVHERCARLTEADHDAYYRPAYQRSVETARTLGRVAPLDDDATRRGYVGDNGVFVIATDGSDGKPPRVVSAYRMALTAPERRSAEEYADAAARAWRDKTAMMRAGRRTDGGETP